MRVPLREKQAQFEAKTTGINDVIRGKLKDVSIMPYNSRVLVLSSETITVWYAHLFVSTEFLFLPSTWTGTDGEVHLLVDVEFDVNNDRFVEDNH